MRKIERMMLTAIQNGYPVKVDNTRVCTDNNGIRIYLRANMIAAVYDNRIEIQDCGHQSNLTKSRINVLLSQFTNGARITQKNFQWFLYNNGQQTPWVGNATIDFSNGETSCK